MAVIIVPSIANINVITTGLDPLSYPAFDGLWGMFGIEYPNGGISPTSTPSLVNANKMYDTETYSSNSKIGILLPISSLGVPTIFPPPPSSGGNSIPQYRHPRWSRY